MPYYNQKIGPIELEATTESYVNNDYTLGIILTCPKTLSFSQLKDLQYLIKRALEETEG